MRCTQIEVLEKWVMDKIYFDRKSINNAIILETNIPLLFNHSVYEAIDPASINRLIYTTLAGQNFRYV